MIRITDRWSVYRDSMQWVLLETYMGKDKHGNPKVHQRETYHPWLEQALRSAADRDCEGAKSLWAVMASYLRVRYALKDAVSALERDYAKTYAELQETKRKLSQAVRAEKERKTAA